MERINELFLTALRAALRGERSLLPEDLTLPEWQELLGMAEVHRLLPMIFEAVHASPVLQSLEGANLALTRRKVKQHVVLQTLRTGEFLELNAALRAAGATPLVVKGIVCRGLYPQPDHRPSGDEDVLIRPEEFDICHRVMIQLGMQPGSENLDSYEIPYRKPGSPLYIELHKHLFPPESSAYGDLNRFFEGVYDRAVEVEVPGGRVWTPAPADHMFYLICHAFKHFLHSGFGIRQVCDIVLFANRHGGEVDWRQVIHHCEAIRADKFAAAIFRIGEKYLGFDSPEVFWAMDVDEGPMLEDLLLGGLYGDANLSRKHSSTITLDAVAAEKEGRKPRGAMLATAFPPAAKLEGNYPYLKEKPWLLPLAWGQRLWKFSRETRTTEDNSAAEALKIGSERLELMKTYGIIR